MLGKSGLIALALVATSTAASAAVFTFTGDIQYHNDVISTEFTVGSDATNVLLWTDSFDSAINFDPITALWNATTGALIQENDDNPTISPGTQTFFDSGFSLPSLTAGTYFFTVATYANFAAGTNISDGFAYDNQTPIPLSQWCQPANHCNMGTQWSVWLSGVDSAVNPNPGTVPEPAILALLGIGLGALALTRRQLLKKAAT